MIERPLVQPLAGGGDTEPAIQMAVAAVARRPLSRGQRFVLALDRGIYRIARRWLVLVNSALAAYALAMLAAPLLVAAGYGREARPIYSFAGLFCHQRPNRTFTLYGHKMACCQRCFAIYGTLALAGLCFALLRGRVRTSKPVELALLALPVAIDGGAQAIGLWHSTPASRVATGALLGVAMAWWLMPYLQHGFTSMADQLERRFARLAAAGIVRPLRGAGSPA